MIERILITLICFLAAKVIHITVFHFFTFKKRARVMELIFAIFFLIQIILIIVLPPNFLLPDIKYSLLLNLVTAGNAIALYLLFFFVYANIYFVIDRSISIRVMIELQRNPEKGLSKEELLQYYNGNHVFDRRLDHMVEGNFVSLVNGRYVNTKMGSVFARVCKFGKKFLNLGSGG